jgi:DNA mismatch repair protein MLH1
MQFGTKMILLDHAALSYGLFRQLSLRRFGVAPMITFKNSLDVREALEVVYDVLHGKDTVDKVEVIHAKTSLLCDKAMMLLEYFSIHIDEEGQLIGLPELLPAYTPLPDELPMFLWRLSSIPWDGEYECFEAIFSEIGLLYCVLPDEMDGDELEPITREERKLGPIGENILVNTFLPAIRHLLITSADYEDIGIVTQLASLEQLYKIFERC